jgi:hypothetical protein
VCRLCLLGDTRGAFMGERAFQWLRNWSQYVWIFRKLWEVIRKRGKFISYNIAVMLTYKLYNKCETSKFKLLKAFYTTLSKWQFSWILLSMILKLVSNVWVK